ncbi:hypothetical protein [Sphingosinicella sp. BN140058]|uniref:hypothetical protein n=1 Tax=Sphingosinicella sp. BN140058 TaxID=1892855 RepID=UPI001011AEA3|nr:hypothetical protein [Sphingosinicella sp. BN140058]QAY76660.1 hypothetical protein ETR14_09230 [Sphingosinicella sp. BN140058]
MRTIGRMAALGTAMLAAACVPKPQPETAPPPRPQAPAPLAPPAVPPPPPRAWSDLALTPGNWAYGSAADGSRATFGPTAANPLFVVRCDRAGRRVMLTRSGAGTGQMVVRTSYGSRSLPVAAGAGGITATLPATDPLLDQIAFSRGRFTIDVAGLPELVIPAWPEPARVTEDCRN